ncbi:MAG: universal stress protein [Acidobacteriota bacterium]
MPPIHTSLRTVLVGTSLELASDPVVRTGVELARRSGAALHLFHAHTLPVAYFAAPSGLTTIGPDLLDNEKRVRENLLDQQLGRLGMTRADVDGVIIEAGSPHRMLLREAGNLAADVIVVGSNEGADIVRLGSTADRVLRQATVPVWMVDGRPRMPPRQVLAPVDLSDLSAEALERGIRLLDDVCSDEAPTVEALFVLAEEEVEGSGQFTAEQIRRMAHDELERFVSASAPDRPTRNEVREGEVRAEILRHIAEQPIDLVLLGTHGRSGFERFLLGSVAADIASRAGVSALVIPPERAGETS